MRTPGIGPVTYRQLIARFGTAAAALAAVPDLAAARRRQGAGAVQPRRRRARDRAGREARRALSGARAGPLSARCSAELEDAPPLLIAKGDLNLLDRQAVAIVGARNASAAACRFARGLAHDLGQQDLVVVSGLARGIDSAAHDGALDSGTIGVIAGGIDIFYPPENEDAAEGALRTRAGDRRNAAGDRAARAAFPLSQPDHRRAERRDGRGRGGAALGLADHRAARGRGGARSHGRARARRSIRAPRAATS